MQWKELAESLGQLKHLKGEVDDLSQRIAELELAAQGGVGRISGMPRGRAASDRVAEYAVRIADLRELLEDRRIACMEEIGRLYALIDDIQDSLTRRIMTYRYIDALSWQQIAFRIGESDEQYPRRLHNRFLADYVRAQANPDENDERGAL